MQSLQNGSQVLKLKSFSSLYLLIRAEDLRLGKLEGQRGTVAGLFQAGAGGKVPCRRHGERRGNGLLVLVGGVHLENGRIGGIDKAVDLVRLPGFPAQASAGAIAISRDALVRRPATRSTMLCQTESRGSRTVTNGWLRFIKGSSSVALECAGNVGRSASRRTRCRLKSGGVRGEASAR